MAPDFAACECLIAAGSVERAVVEWGMEQTFPLRLPAGTNDLAALRGDHELYVDKTAHIADLLDEAGKYCFLARPRRFGKSLLVSTLEHLCRGHTDLFQGTAIQDRRPRSGHWTWPEPSPVIRLNMNALDTENAATVKEGLADMVVEIFDGFALPLSPHTSNPIRLFHRLLSAVAVRLGRVTVLIDEYDYPLLHNLAHPDLPTILDVLANFYGVLKNHDAHLRFVFLTGGTRFARLGLFSGLNNLLDVSHIPRWHGLLGFTQAEVDAHLTPFMHDVRDRVAQPVAPLPDRLREYYNGYCFAPGIAEADRLYNPFSLIQCLHAKQLIPYWSETGLPRFLPAMLEGLQGTVAEVRGIPGRTLLDHVLRVEDLAALWQAGPAVPADPPVMTLAQLMFQTGYLTLERDRATGTYVTDFPNLEVTTAFVQDLFQHVGRGRVFDFRYMEDICRVVEACDPQALPQAANRLFRQLTHVELREHAYQALIHAALLPLQHCLGVQAEVSTYRGRTDLVVDMPARHGTVIMEFKMTDNPQNALPQALDRDYAGAWRDKGRTVHVWGIPIDVKKRQMLDVVPLELPPHREPPETDFPAYGPL